MKKQKIIICSVFILVYINAFSQKRSVKKINIDSLYQKDIDATKIKFQNIEIRDYPTNNIVNGTESLVREIIKYPIRYPKYAKEHYIQGIVYCMYLVDTLGKMINYNVIKGIGGGCDEVALELLSEFSKRKFVVNPKKQYVYQKLQFNFILK